MALEKLAQIPSLVRKAGQAASKAQPFYSPVDQAIANITQGKGTGAQMLAELMKTKGVAKELKDRPAIKKALEQPKVTKQELEQVAAENPAPQIEEVADAGSKFASYTIPGGENYREVLIKIPRKEINKEQREAIIAKRKEIFAEYNPKIEAIHQKMLESKDRDQYNKLYDEFDRLSEERNRKAAQYAGEVPEFLEPIRYQSSHFDEPNILAHARVSDRVGPNGERILHVEEVQSDWHQEGRKKGYKTPDIEARLKGSEEEIEKIAHKLRGITNRMASLSDNDLDEFNRLANERQALNDRQSVLISEANSLSDVRAAAVPDAPFKQNWHELVMKRLLDDAARNGYDKVVITPGAEQAKRYDLSKQIGRVVYNPETEMLNAFDLSNRSVIQRGNVKPDQIEEYIGKEPAKRLLDQQNTKIDSRGGKDVPYQEISGLDLQVGGEGMKGFYDQILPSYLNEYGKKYGVRVGTYDMPVGEKMVPDRAGLGMISSGEQEMVPFHSFDITPQMREDITTKGMPLYQVAPPVAIGAGASMQEEQLEQYAGGGAVKKALKAVLPKGQQAVLPAAESAENLAKMLKPSVAKNRLYHGTQGYDDYADEQGQAFRQFSGRPTWLAEEPYTASGYSAGKGTTYPVYAQVKKPLALNFDANDDASKAFQVAKSLGVDLGWMKSMNNPEKAWEVVSHPSFIDAVEKAGYDGLMLNEGGYKTYGVLDPRKIKSSIGNRGAYDITDPDINMAGGGLLKKAAKGLLPKGQQAVLPAAESAANLERFLADSAVKDRLYHATSKDFSQFSAKKLGQNTRHPTAKLGFFTAENPASTEDFIASTSGISKGLYEPGANVMPLHLSIKNPYEIPSSQYLLQSMALQNMKKKDADKFIQDFIDSVKAEGHDGLLIKANPNGLAKGNEFASDNWVAFEPTQIKSAIGNRGTYDINEAEINKAKGGQVSKDTMWMAVQNKQLRKKHGN